MKALSLIRVLSVFIALLASMLGVMRVQAGSVLPLPGVNGPSLGDPTTNIFSIMQQLQLNTTSNFSSFTTLTVAASNTTSTVLNYGFNFLTAASGVTATVMLPTAKPGAQVVVSNNTGVVTLVFGNGVNPFTAGGIDFVNNVAFAVSALGNGGYVLTNGLTISCFSPQGGNWWCTH